MADILLVEDAENPRKALSMLLRKNGYTVVEAANGQKALDLLNDRLFDLVITDVKMEPVDGMELLEQVKKSHPTTEVIVITAYGTIESGVKAIKLGAFDYITKPFENEDFLTLVASALENRITREIKKQFYQKITYKGEFQNIIASSKAMKQVLHLVAQVATTESTVLIYGESGTGKELIAKAIHANSTRSHRPLLTINCGALPESLLESELFGHVKGAFTGAIRDKKGLFEEANHGTLFLDEIGEISPATQVKLLRVLQENEIRRVGDNNPIAVDVRIIAATNKNLEEQITLKNFREDLYYRLNVIPIHVPALRERKDEIPVLANFFLQKFATKYKKTPPTISPSGMSMLVNYHWPGNVRELENLIERTIILNYKPILGPEDFKLNSFKTSQKLSGFRVRDSNYSLMDAEKSLIMECLESCNGNQKLSADMLGISTTTLWRKLKKYQINLDEIKSRE